MPESVEMPAPLSTAMLVTPAVQDGLSLIGSSLSTSRAGSKRADPDAVLDNLLNVLARGLPPRGKTGRIV
jgi:hypothetical protein